MIIFFELKEKSSLFIIYLPFQLESATLSCCPKNRSKLKIFVKDERSNLLLFCYKFWRSRWSVCSSVFCLDRPNCQISSQKVAGNVPKFYDNKIFHSSKFARVHSRQTPTWVTSTVPTALISNAGERKYCVSEMWVSIWDSRIHPISNLTEHSTEPLRKRNLIMQHRSFILLLAPSCDDKIKKIRPTWHFFFAFIHSYVLCVLVSLFRTLLGRKKVLSFVCLALLSPPYSNSTHIKEISVGFITRGARQLRGKRTWFMMIFCCGCALSRKFHLFLSPRSFSSSSRILFIHAFLFYTRNKVRDEWRWRATVEWPTWLVGSVGSCWRNL